MFVVRFFHLSLQIFKPSLVNAKLSDKVNKVDARMCGWSVFHATFFVMSTVKKANFLVLHLFFRALLSGRVKKKLLLGLREEQRSMKEQRNSLSCHLPSFRRGHLLSLYSSIFYIHFSSRHNHDRSLESKNIQLTF